MVTDRPNTAVLRRPASTATASSAAPREGLTESERYAYLVHEIRNLVDAAWVAVQVLRRTDATVHGEAGGVLQRSLSALRELINGSLTDVRRRQEVHQPVRVAVATLVDEVAAAAALDAARRGLHFRRTGDAEALAVYADRQLLASVLVNLLQNAFKFTRPGTTVVLAVSATPTRVRFEIEDECGGLGPGSDDPAHATTAHGDDIGLGLGLAFSRRCVEAADGRITSRRLAGHGCVYTVDLPRLTADAGDARRPGAQTISDALRGAARRP